MNQSESFDFNCEVTGPSDPTPDCLPYERVLRTGKYFIELWGAQGGNTTGKVGGNGGYVSGYINLYVKTKVYIYLGEAGMTGTSIPQRLRKTFGGGGMGLYGGDCVATSGGGMSWVTINSPAIENAILKAAGGSGAAYFQNGGANDGSPGGGLIGIDGKQGYWRGTYYAFGTSGKETAAGTNSYCSECNGNFNNGGNNKGENQIGSGGGSGHFGGAAGSVYGATGGRGSSWYSVLIENGNTIAGNSLMPSPFNSSEFYGNYGNGKARITFTVR